jgi:hypothetical protein
MGETYYIGPHQLAHMRTMSAAHLAAHPEPPGSPYYVPPVARPPVVEPVPVEVPVAEPPKVSALDAAVAWLETALVPDGLTAGEVEQRASEAGHAMATVRRAARRLACSR